MEKEPMAGSLFGTLLRRHRLAAGLSQEVLAEQARMSANGIGALERGDRRYPYRETVMLLAKALDLAPAAIAQLEAAAARPRQPRAGADGEASVDEPRSATNVPLQRTSLIGRDADIGKIVEMLRDNRLVTVTGAGGVGKTRTALAVGDAVVADTPAGVWLVELAPLAQGSVLESAIAQALSIQESPNRSLLATLLAYLKRKSLLLVLDNCDHIIAEAAAIADALLGSCPQLRILATSRESLRIAGEHTYWLPSLREPTLRDAVGLSAVGAAEYAAVVLFAQNAQAIDNGFALSDDNAPIVAEICRRLDGIPLAIELAAARVNILPVRALSQKLDQRFRILTDGNRTALPRHRTMRALIDWSYDLLTPHEQRLFECLSVFAGGCSLAAAAVVYADGAIDELSVFDLLSSLVNKSLVVADIAGPEPRYRLLESSRAYAYEKLSARGEATLVAHRHASVYLDVAKLLDREHDVRPDSAWVARAELELDNCRAALEFAIGARGDVVLGQRLARAMVYTWMMFSVSEGRRWVRTALELVDERTPALVAARLENTAAGLAWLAGEFDTALSGSRRALEVCRELGDAPGTARAQWVAGISLINLGHVVEGETLLQSTLDATRSLNMPRYVAFCLQGIAHARSLAGDYSGVREYVTEALAIFDAIGGIEYYAHRATMLLAKIEFLSGNVDRAVQLSTATAATMPTRFSFHFAQTLSDAATYLIACDRWVDAHEYAREALELAQETQYDVCCAWTIQHLAAIAALSPPADHGPRSEKSERAARVLGYVDALIATLGVSRQHTEQREYDRVLNVLRKAFVSDELTRFMAAGAAMTEDQAVLYALEIGSAGCNDGPLKNRRHEHGHTNQRSTSGSPITDLR